MPNPLTCCNFQVEQPCPHMARPRTRTTVRGPPIFPAAGSVYARKRRRRRRQYSSPPQPPHPTAVFTMPMRRPPYAYQQAGWLILASFLTGAVLGAITAWVLDLAR